MIVRLRETDINVEAGGPVPEAARPTLVMIHGFGASLRTWDPIVPHLEPRYAIVRSDLKGFGLSGHPRDGNYTIDENAEIVLALIRHQQLRRVVLIGHSYGGAVALMVAARLSASSAHVVDGLVLIDAASYQQRLPYFVEIGRHLAGRLISRLTPIDFGTRFVLRSLFADKSLVDPAMVERYAFPRRVPGAAYSEAQTAQQILPASFDEVTQTIRSIRVPTQIIWGGRDPAVPPAFADRLHQDIQGSQLHVVPGAGHLPHEEQPAEVLRVINRFLEELSPCAV